MSDFLAVSMKGFRALAKGMIEKRGYGLIGGELWQNAMDEKPSIVTFTVKPLPGTPRISVVVEDDGPGYRDLSHAWTLYAPSFKKDNPEQAGRFNRGCKIVLALCKEATIETTSGTVAFSQETGRTIYKRRKRANGTVFNAIMEGTRTHCEELVRCLRSILPPVHDNPVKLIVNGQEVTRREPLCTFSETLPTEIGETLRTTARKCDVQVHEVMGEEEPHLYELGIPVMPINCKWHINVMQKVPLNSDRDNVRPKYLNDLLAYTINHMYDKIAESDVEEIWVEEATDNKNCSPEAMGVYLTQRYGKKRVVFDPSDTEANNRAVANGYTVIPSRGLTSGQRTHLRDNPELAKPSGQVFPTEKAYAKDGPPADVLSDSQLSDGMKRVRKYTEELGLILLGVKLNVQFVKTSNNFIACFGGNELHYNVKRLGFRWFEGPMDEKKNKLIIHEFGHFFESNHLSDNYHSAICTLGAKMVQLALENPKMFSLDTH